MNVCASSYASSYYLRIRNYCCSSSSWCNNNNNKLRVISNNNRLANQGLDVAVSSSNRTSYNNSYYSRHCNFISWRRSFHCSSSIRSSSSTSYSLPAEHEVSKKEEEEGDCPIDEFLQLKQETEKLLHHKPRNNNVEEIFSVFQQWAMLPRAIVPNAFQIADPMDALFRLYLQQTSSMFVDDDPYLERQKTRMLNIILRQWKWDLLRSSSVEVSRRNQKQRQKQQQQNDRDDPDESSAVASSSSQHLRKVAIQNAEALFQYCCSSHKNRSSSPSSSVLVQPDLETYHSLMNLSLTMSHVSLSYVIQAETYLRLMMSLPEQQMDTFVLLPNNNDFYYNLHGEQQPFTFDTRSFNNVLHGYSRRRQEGSSQDEYAAEAASRSCRLLKEMHELSSSADCHYSFNVRPNLTTYKFVLVALSRSPEDDAPTKCEELLQTMQNLAAAGYQSSEDCDTNNTNNSSNNNPNSSSGNSMEPDIACYNTVLHAWWRRNTVAAAERCTHIVQRMIQLHQDGYIRAKPNSFTFDACIRAWARIEGKEAPLDGAERAESILTRMIAYSDATRAATIRTIAPAGDLLERQNVDTACEDCLPSTASFNNVISLWTKARHQEDHLERAERILDMLLQEHNSGNNAHARPTSNSFFSIMIAYMRQGRKRQSVGGFVHAERVYRKMEEVDIIPPDAKSHALQATMEMLASYSQENHRVARHQQQELNDITTTIFNHLCRNGYLTNRVLNILKQVVSSNVYMATLKIQTKNAKFSIDALPKEWSRNIIDYQGRTI